MVSKKKVETSKWDDAREVLVVAGTPVRDALEEGEVFESTYLGKVRRKSRFGHVWMHLFLTSEGMQGMWGHHALDEGMERAERGVETRIDGLGMMDLDKGMRMRLIRIRQLGSPIAGVPIIRDSEQEAQGVYEALGIEGEYRVDHETGEVMEVDTTAPTETRRVFNT